jgi:hypothetical protein
LAKHEGGRIALRDLLGREPIDLDPRIKPVREGPTREEIEMFEKAGSPGGVMTEEEIATAYDELIPPSHRHLFALES